MMTRTNHGAEVPMPGGLLAHRSFVVSDVGDPCRKCQGTRFEVSDVGDGCDEGWKCLGCGDYVVYDGIDS